MKGTCAISWVCMATAWWRRAGAAPLLPDTWDSFILLPLGLAELALSHVDQAMAWWAQAQKLARETGSSGDGDASQFLITCAMIVQGNLAPVAGRLHECLRLFNRSDNRMGSVCALVQRGGLAGLQGKLHRACALLGATKALDYELDATGFWERRVLWCWYRDAQQTIVEPTLAAARAQLGDTEFEATYAAGQQMTLEQAVEYALQGGEVGG
jgi:hypothetical protein